MPLIDTSSWIASERADVAGAGRYPAARAAAIEAFRRFEPVVYVIIRNTTSAQAQAMVQNVLDGVREAWENADAVFARLFGQVRDHSPYYAALGSPTLDDFYAGRWNDDQLATLVLAKPRIGFRGALGAYADSAARAVNIANSNIADFLHQMGLTYDQALAVSAQQLIGQRPIANDVRPAASPGGALTVVPQSLTQSLPAGVLSPLSPLTLTTGPPAAHPASSTGSGLAIAAGFGLLLLLFMK